MLSESKTTFSLKILALLVAGLITGLVMAGLGFLIFLTLFVC
jgi:hypothetical protein